MSGPAARVTAPWVTSPIASPESPERIAVARSPVGPGVGDAVDGAGVSTRGGASTGGAAFASTRGPETRATREPSRARCNAADDAGSGPREGGSAVAL